MARSVGEAAAEGLTAGFLLGRNTQQMYRDNERQDRLDQTAIEDRQMLRATRKPLVVMTPKSLLRHKECVSTMAELSRGRFHGVLPVKPGRHDVVGEQRINLTFRKVK